MHKIIALVLLGLTALSGPAWSQANIRPDPTRAFRRSRASPCRVEDALFLREAASASQGQAELGRLAAEKAPDDALRSLAQRISETHGKLAGDLKRLTDARTLPPADKLQPERTDAFGAAGAVSNPENARGGMAQEAVQSLSGAGGEAFGMSDTDRSIKEIARSCGFGSEETMRRSFLRLIEVTPQAYRDRFRSSAVAA